MLTRQRILAIATISALFLSASPSLAVEKCAAFPKSTWWSHTTPKKISSYVSRKHRGSWVSYLNKWNHQLAAMKKIRDRGGMAVFKSRGLTLSGDALQQYIDDLVARIEVTKCYALHALKAEIKKIKKGQ